MKIELLDLPNHLLIKHVLTRERLSLRSILNFSMTSKKSRALILSDQEIKKTIVIEKAIYMRYREPFRKNSSDLCCIF